MRSLLFAAALMAVPAAAQSDPAAEVSEARLRADVEAMVGFGTRHTLSSQDDPERGIGAALRWADREFRAIGEACGGCLQVAMPERMISGDRIPEPVRVADVVAIQRGSERPNEVVIVQGHIDSRVSDVMDAASDAPGANDNASGSALVLEAARVLSQRRYPTTIVYALLSGEEQGLYGGEILADYAAEQGWTVKAVLNNDIVGGSCGSDGVCDAAHVRVFSEGLRADADAATLDAMARNGGENDSPSRNLSRFVAGLDSEELQVRQIWRTDRMGRGGDQIPFLDRGYPAIRFSVAIEDYEHQHQDLRVEDRVTYGDTVDEMDFSYLAKVTRLNVGALAALARAPMPPAPKIEAAVRNDTLLTWDWVPGGISYHLYARRTDESEWTPLSEFGENLPVFIVAMERVADTSEVPDISESIPLRGDDWLFGVSSMSEGGFESPIASAVPGGAFAPLGTE